MEILTASFEEKIIISLPCCTVEMILFKLPEEHGNVKFGLNAPSNIKVNREEVYHLKRIKDTKNGTGK